MRRLLALIIAIAAFGTLATRIWLKMETGVAPLDAVWDIYRYYTIWMNTAVGLAALVLAFGGDLPGRLQSNLMLQIGAVAIVYYALLARLVTHEGIDAIVDTMFHAVIPGLWTLYWVVFTPKVRLRLAMVPGWLVLPAVYSAYAVARGQVDGTYPYFFLDVAKHGWIGVAQYSAGLLVAFALGGVIIVLLGRALAWMLRTA